MIRESEGENEREVESKGHAVNIWPSALVILPRAMKILALSGVMVSQASPTHYRALHNSLQFPFRDAVFGCVCRGWNVTMSHSNYSTVNGQMYQCWPRTCT
jgi:hypothetical protein